MSSINKLNIRVECLGAPKAMKERESCFAMKMKPDCGTVRGGRKPARMLVFRS
jgi:hypothetical protein